MMRNRLGLNLPGKTALVEEHHSYSYADTNLRAERFATGLLNGAADLVEERIAFLIPASLDYVTVLHGIWRAGGIAIPLNVMSTLSEIEHYLASTGASRLVVAESHRNRIDPLCKQLAIKVISVEQCLRSNVTKLPIFSSERRAMILFTSGTTSKPKGVVTTHKAIEEQITVLVKAWKWEHNDVIPLFLPLHHVHGIIAVLGCALWSGATVHLMPKLDIAKLCGQVASGTFNVFMAVPTIYVKLIDHLEAIEAEDARKIRKGFAEMRLQVSGSAACPEEVFETWRRLTGQTLLERYGMTEIGMAISNPYIGERRAGHVGQALPGVSVQLFDEDSVPVTKESMPGEIRIKGENVFLEYWGDPVATKSSFIDGWFCSGDIGLVEDGYYKILGRASVDIIKSGGYKISALEIEDRLLTHPNIAEVAVLGVNDRIWGEAVAAVVVLRGRKNLGLEELKVWCEDKLSGYKIPKKLEILDNLPRNAMGKVVKPDLGKLF